MKREKVKQTAIDMVEEAGLINLSRSALCARAGIPDGSFPHVMGCNFSEFVEELRGICPDPAHVVSQKSSEPGVT